VAPRRSRRRVPADVHKRVGDDLASAAAVQRAAPAAHPRFLEKGFYLFRSEQHFGIAGHPDRVALFPRSDRYEILRLMGTNGWNDGIGPDSIVAWLRALERFYAFCPDVVDQGTEAVDALAQDLGESQRLYCWWD